MTTALSKINRNLFTAVAKNDLAEIKRCLEKGANVHARDENHEGEKPIHVAAFYGYTAIVRFFLSSGLSVDEVDIQKQTTLLHYASQNNQFRVVELLAKKGANIHAVNVNKCKPIHTAAQEGHADIVKFFLMSGVSVDETDAFGCTPLYLAAYGGHLEVVKLLIRKGARVDLKSSYNNKTPLDIAEEKKFTQIARFLKRNQNALFLHIPTKEEEMARKKIVDRISQDLSLVYVVAGEDSGRAAWHYLLVDRDKKKAFLEKSETRSLHFSNYADYGKILYSGFGKSAPQIIQNKIERFSRRASDDLFIMKGEFKGKDIYYYMLVDPDKKTTFEKYVNEGLLSVSEIENYVKVLFCGWGEDPARSVSCALNKHYLFRDETDWKDQFYNLSMEEDNTFHDAARNGELDRIMDFVGKGVDVNEPDSKGWTPLHHAGFGGDVVALKYLIDHGADLHAKDICGRKPLHISAREGNVDATELCMSNMYAKVDDADENGWTALHYAVWKGHLRCIELLIMEGADVDVETTLGLGPLHVAVRRGHVDVVKLLLTKGVNIKGVSSKNGLTALHFSTTLDDIEMFKFLLYKGANIHAKSLRKVSVLHCAAIYGQIDVLKELITMNVNIHDTDMKGLTALHYAAANGHVDFVELLVDKNANIEAKMNDNNNRKQAVHLAASNGHTNVIDFLLRKGIYINVTDKNGWIPLHFAAQEGKTDVVKFLLCRGANFEARTSDTDNNQQPIHIAALHGHKNVVEILLSKGKDVNVTNKKGYTPLHCAAKCGKEELVSFLEQKGADNRIKDVDGKTPSDYLLENILE